MQICAMLLEGQSTGDRDYPITPKLPSTLVDARMCLTHSIQIKPTS